MNLIATPTPITDIPAGSMLDIPELPDEYATLIDAQPMTNGVAVVVSHKGALQSMTASVGALFAWVTYAAVSNALETSK